MPERISLKDLLEDEGLLMVPGAYNALTAKLIEDAGFKAVYMTGYGTSAANFGFPDIGLLTMTEMVENVSRIANSVSIPVISDADTGYGNQINVFRTIQEFEKAGVSAIHIEDQTWPKRCGHMSGKSVIETNEMIKKIKTAIDSRKKDDFLIIARTDAIATHGFDEAIKRAKEYAKAGADILFLDAPRTKNQVKKIPKLIKEKPLLINLSPKTPNFSKKELEDMGYKIAIYPGVSLAATVLSCMEDLNELKETGEQI
ncbi:MAG: 2,3-dimethylmalate lyase [Promethearchaeota archaeon]|nr:MAG: 2,3-dimethylmalate lyase [Candidatus Lokiarchaeota archaeon]